MHFSLPYQVIKWSRSNCFFQGVQYWILPPTVTLIQAPNYTASQMSFMFSINTHPFHRSMKLLKWMEKLFYRTVTLQAQFLTSMKAYQRHIHLVWSLFMSCRVKQQPKVILRPRRLGSHVPPLGPNCLASQDARTYCQNPPTMHCLLGQWSRDPT